GSTDSSAPAMPPNVITSSHVGGRMLRLGDAFMPVAVGEQALEWKRVSGLPQSPMPAAHTPVLSSLA
ncbi:hypothetical protein HMPREF0549_0560, partial [Limosilactobacillus vaginalis DSM 5837 = ATCC 49540]